MKPRLRQRLLTLDGKPRVISSYSGQYWAEKMTPDGPIVETKATFQEAINLASWWGAVRNEAKKLVASQESTKEEATE